MSAEDAREPERAQVWRAELGMFIIAGQRKTVVLLANHREAEFIDLNVI